MKILRTEQNVPSLPKPNQCRVVYSDKRPPVELITATFVYAFDGDRLLMTHLKSRGWDLPGGHIEPGETPARAARREVYEETGARLNQIDIFAHIHMHIDGPEPDDYAYPYPDSYMVFYWAHIDTLENFNETDEVSERGLFFPEQARQTHYITNNRELYRAAFECAVDLTPKPEAPWKHKAFALILRPDNSGYKLLALHFEDTPAMPLRFPGGNLDPGETPKEAMYRELYEESGLGRLKILRKLGVHHYYKYYIQSNVERHDYLLLAPRNTPDQWAHIVTGEDADADYTFNYQWIGADEIDSLSDELNTFVTPEHIPELFSNKSR